MGYAINNANIMYKMAAHYYYNSEDIIQSYISVMGAVIVKL